MKISKIILCKEHASPATDTAPLKQFLSETFGVAVETGGDLSCDVARTRILDLKRPFQRHPPGAGMTAVDEEFRAYDGFELQRVLREECIRNHTADTLYIVITDRLTCTFDADDFRYHARAVICANPAIVSATGMVEAPAKPKQYYLDVISSLSRDDADGIRQRYEGRFLEHSDPRIPEVMKGYLLQAVMYYETGDAFCSDAECRLNNSHWQEDLLRLQLETGTLCPRHQRILRQLRC